MKQALKSEIVSNPNYFDRYIAVVPDDDLFVALTHSLDNWMKMDWDRLARIGDKVYAPGKWTIKEVLQHINDTERIMSYRALRFARNDKTLLPGYDENYFVEHSNANERSLEALKEEFILLRKSSLNMYESFNEECLLRRGICFNVDLSVLALGFILAGHQIHHMNIIRERYFLLAD
ncbi:MAG: DinB family protein [Bacteroidetes bacterium]|nr:DinB family protein [Bacteroidota bacterium]